MRENNSFLTVCFQQKHVKIYIIFSGTPGMMHFYNINIVLLIQYY